MPVTREETQVGLQTTLTFQCWCSEHTYLRISAAGDEQWEVSIDMSPTRLGERLKLAWKCLRGLEFSTSNSVLLDKQSMIRLSKELKVLK